MLTYDPLDYLVPDKMLFKVGNITTQDIVQLRKDIPNIRYIMSSVDEALIKDRNQDGQPDIVLGQPGAMEKTNALLKERLPKSGLSPELQGSIMDIANSKNAYWAYLYYAYAIDIARKKKE